jgi:xylan 1,4-beta-xylosidase
MRRIYRPAAKVALLLAILLSGSAVPSTAPADPVSAQPFPVSIRVDAGKSLGMLPKAWRFFGADEPNYAYLPDGRKLIGELGALAPSRVMEHRH